MWIANPLTLAPMEAFDETSGPLRSVSPRGPVFVDASGRRLRRVKLIGLGALGLVAGYAILLLVAFGGGSNIAAPYLPLPAPSAGPKADDLPSSASVSRAPGVPAAKVPSAEPATPASFEAPVNTPSAVPAARPSPAASSNPAAPLRPEASPAPSAAPPAKSAASERKASLAPVTDPAVSTESSPGKSGEAPGQTRRPSTPTRP